MDIPTCTKYLEFVAYECKRYNQDKHVSDDELINLVIEFKRFQEKVTNSHLPEEIKRKIAELQFNYTIKGVERGSQYLALAIITFGSWAALIHYRRQNKRRHLLNALEFDTSRLASYIKMNF